MPKQFDVDTHLRDSFGVFKGDPEGDYEVVVDFDAWAADEIRGRKWHQSQDVTELPKGAMRLRLRLNNLEEVERWLLSFGAHATVDRPRALRERLAKVGQEYLGRYAEPEG